MMWEVETTKLKEPSKGVKEPEQEKVEEAGPLKYCTPLATAVPPSWTDLEPERAWYEGVRSERWTRWAAVGRRAEKESDSSETK